QREVLGELLSSYWRPLYAYLRRKGMSPPEAEDCVQGFAVRLLEKNFLASLDPGRGRLRAYLKTALSHYVSNVREQAAAEKRGGHAKMVSLDFATAEQALAHAPLDAEHAYRRAWAEQVFDHALAAFRSEFLAQGKKGPLEILVGYFRGEPLPPYPDLAQKHKMPVPQLKSFVHRARIRFRELVEAEVLHTVGDPGEVASEIGELLHGS